MMHNTQARERAIDLSGHPGFFALYGPLLPLLMINLLTGFVTAWLSRRGGRRS